MQTYHVKVFTGDVFGAGTDANVFCILFGEKDNTGNDPCDKSVIDCYTDMVNIRHILIERLKVYG